MIAVQFKIHNKLGQSSLEICVLIVCIVSALIAMQVYIKRAIQGRMRQAADDIGQQYSPGNTYSDMYTYMENSSVSISEIVSPKTEAGRHHRETTETSSSVTLRTGQEKIRGFQFEYFGETPERLVLKPRRTPGEGLKPPREDQDRLKPPRP